MHKIEPEYPQEEVIITPIVESYENKNSCRIRTDFVFDLLETIEVPLLDEHLLINEDVILHKDDPPRFAYSIPVTITPFSHGSWQQLDEWTQIWRVRILSEGALNLNLGFTKFNMPSGGCLFLYSPDHRNVIGPFSDKDNEAHGQLWTPIIDGEEVIIEVTVPIHAISGLTLEIGYVNHGYQ